MVVNHRLLRSCRQRNLLRTRAEPSPLLQNLLGLSTLVQLDRDRFGMAILDCNTIALCADLERRVFYGSVLKHAEKLAGLSFQFLFLFWNKRNHIAQNVKRGDTRISGAAHRLHGRDEDGLHPEGAVKWSERHDESDSRAVWICRNEPAIALASGLLLDQLQVIAVHFGDYEWHILLHAKGTRVRDDGVTCLGKFWFEFFRNTCVESSKNYSGSAMR